jgi:putative FmdB family regulatory protein
MPIYEFRCNSCWQKYSLLTKSIAQPLSPQCPACGSQDAMRLVSSFAHHKSEKTRLEEAGEPPRFPGLDYYKDPRNIGRWAEKRIKELGLEMPSKVEEMIQAAREGELPEPVKDLQPGPREV